MLTVTQLHPKVAASTLAGAVAVVGEWVVTTTTHITIPGSVDAAIIFVLTFLAGYIVPSGSADNPTDVTPTATVV